MTRTEFLWALMLTITGSTGRCGQRDPVGGNSYSFKTEDGLLFVEFLSSSSFRIKKWWGTSSTEWKGVSEEKVPVTVKESRDSTEFLTRYLRVELEKRGGRLRVADTSGRLLLEDVRAAVRTPQGIFWERRLFEGETFRGLGPEGGMAMWDVPRRTVETSVPFLMSSLGYGEYFRAEGVYRYEFGRSRRVLSPGASECEYFFYYGPTPKEILEEHVAVERPPVHIVWSLFDLQSRLPERWFRLPESPPDWDGLAALIRWVQQCSYSAVLLPALNVQGWLRAPAEIRERALALSVFFPVIYGGPDEGTAQVRLRRARRRWVPFLVSYGYEARERGFPLIRPLDMQYANDPEARHQPDEFMVGDELLVAPLLGRERARRVYLPVGHWTEWHSNRRHAGRRLVELEAPEDGILLLVKNGSLVPVLEDNEGRVVSAHYFPRLAGEFFMYEDLDGALTQLHAAPAGEWLRLEVEPARARTWEWVVHHVERPTRVWSGAHEYGEANQREDLGPGRWWHDASKKNLHVQVRTAAGGVYVLYASF